jgi:allophanate hydrolase subunit 2
MIRLLRPAVAASIQDQGRFGHRAKGFARSGAMDPQSLRLANLAAGAPVTAAGLEFGPGPLAFEVTRSGKIAFGGAGRRGASWWETVEVSSGESFDLSAPSEGTWSYLAVGGGLEAPVVAGSRSTNVREGIGRWLDAGSELTTAGAVAEPRRVEPAPMSGPVRIFGELPGSWRVSSRRDRMGYQLDGDLLQPGPADEWSEPVLPGCIQVMPSGVPVVLMVEGSTMGGYRVAAVVHSEDLRLIAQTPAGSPLKFVSLEGGETRSGPARSG